MSVPAADERRLLVIGSGFIAAALANTAAAKWKWAVDVVYRDYRNPTLSDIPCHRLPASVHDLAELIELLRPTDVVFALGSSFVPDVNRDLDSALDQHLNSALMVFDALARLHQPLAGKLLVIGSASEYGEFSEQAVDESHVPRPRDHYGLIKLALCHAGQYFHRAHGTPVVHVRQFNVTGVGQDIRFVLPSVCRQIASIVCGAQAGMQGIRSGIVAGNTAVRRDFLAIGDVCEAYRTLLLHGVAGQVYNVCSGQAVAISELIALAAEVAGVAVEVEVSPQLLRENDNAQAVILGNPARLKNLGWAPTIGMKALLTEMIQTYAAEQTPAKRPTRKEA